MFASSFREFDLFYVSVNFHFKTYFFSGVINPISYKYHSVHHLHPQELRGDIVYGRPHHESVSEQTQAPTNEKFPSDRHTQIIFKSTTAAPFHDAVLQNTEIEHKQHSAMENLQTPIVFHGLEQYYSNPEPNYDRQSHDKQINEDDTGIITYICTNYPVRIILFFIFRI